MLAISVRQGWQSVQAGNWPTTEGTLDSIHVIKDEEADSDESRYALKTAYHYRIDDREYLGRRVAFGYDDAFLSKGHGSIYEKLKDAKLVTVRYDPRNPSSSVLSYGIHSKTMLGILFSLLWLAFFGGVATISWIDARPDHVLLSNIVTHQHADDQKQVVNRL